MEKAQNILAISTALLITFCIILLPSFSLGLTELFNEKRIAEGTILILSGISFFLIFLKHRINIEKKSIYILAALTFLLLVSSFQSNYVDRALLEIGWYMALVQLALFLGFIYQRNQQMFEKILVVGIILMAGVYSVRVYGEILTYFLSDNYPIWPNHRMSTIIINGENIAENGFLGFLNFRFFNHIQTWSMPILIFSYFHFKDRMEIGFKCLLIFLISTWWILLFASGARGSVIALVLSFLLVWFLFRKEGIPYAKLFGLTFFVGVVMYVVFFFLLTHEPGRGVVRSDTSGRLDLWITILKSIILHPLLGVGPMHTADLGGDIKITSSHNIYLTWVAEWGIPAFLLFLYLAGTSFYKWTKNAVQTSSPKTIAITFALIAGVVHSTVSGLLITPLSQLLFALLLGWAFGLYYSKNAETLWIYREKAGIIRYTFFIILLIINAVTFSIFVSDIPKLKQSRDKFQTLHRESRIEMNTKIEPTIFPRFWDQGFIGLEQIEEKK